MPEGEVVAEALVALRADGSQLVHDVESQVKGAVGTAERKAGNAGQVKGLTGELRGLRTASLDSGTALDFLDRATEGSAASMSLLGLGVGAGIAGIKKSIDSFVDLADKVRNFEQLSGASAETSSRFVAVLDDYGISAQTGANAIFFLGRAVASNEKALTDLGVTVKRNRDGSVDLTRTLENVADAYAGTADQGKRNEIVQAALGRQARELIPILQGGGEALRAMLASVPQGQILSDADLQQALDYKLAIDNLHDSFQEIGVTVGREVTPAVGGLANALAEVVRWAGDNRLVRFVTETLLTGGLGFIKFGDEAEGAAEKLRTLTGATEAANEQMEAIAQAQLGIVDASLAARGAQLALEEAVEKQKDAQQDYNDALAGSGKYADQLSSAIKGLASAHHALEQAQRRVRDLTEDIGDKQEDAAGAAIRYGAQSREAIEAQRELRDLHEDLSDAQDEVSTSQQAVAEANKKVADARDLSDERAEAARRLREANLGVEGATNNVAKANVNLKVTQDALNGTVDNATTKASLYRQQLERLMGPLPKDAYNDLASLAKLVDDALAKVGDLGGAFQTGADAITGIATGQGGVTKTTGTDAITQIVGGGITAQSFEGGGVVAQSLPTGDVNVTVYQDGGTDPHQLGQEILFGSRAVR